MTALAAAGLMAAGFAVSVAAPADAFEANQSTLVSAVPAAFTPNINNGVVYAVAQVGNWIVVGGSFTSVTPQGSSTALTQTYVLAFDQTTGALDTGFDPTLSSGVTALAAGPTANTVYVGGSFATVNGVKSKGVTLLNLTDGSIVAGFKPAVLNSAVAGVRLADGHLFLVGGFSTAGGVAHGGIVTLNPTTGALDPYMSVQLTGHHNYAGTGADGAVGGRKIDITPDGTRAIVIGNFKDANGDLHDQIVMLDLGSTAVTIDPNWNTSAFSSPCRAIAFDSYVEDVDFSPDGSYFVIAASGANTTSLNIDGTRSLCDTASLWSTTATGTDVQPTWIDYTGNDSFWSVAATGTAVYAGGHERWVNNPTGVDHPAEGAVPRPGIVALDPVNGLPFTWNPGRAPRGEGAYALLATAQGLYVGSDTNYIGDRKYQRDKIAFFPITGGETIPSTATATLPGNLYQAGPTNGGTPDALVYRSFDGATAGPATTLASTGVSWSSARGAFTAGNQIFWASTDGNFYEATFDGTNVGTPVVLDPYDDPLWDNVQTGSGQTYQGVKPTFYGEVAKLTGAFYSNGRMYYTLSGRTQLFWRYFEPESGTIGGTEFTVTGASMQTVDGMVLSGSTIYYANKNDGSLHTLNFTNGVPTGPDTTIATGGIDWRADGLFIYGS